MHTEPFDAESRTDSELREWHDAVTVLRRDWTPLGVDEPFEVFRRSVRYPMPAEPEWRWGAYEGDALVAAMSVWWHVDPDNAHRVECWIDATDEAPVTALLREAVRFARADGRTVVGFNSPEGSPFSAVADRLGAKLGQFEHLNVVALPDVDQAQLARYVAECERGAPGYELVSFDGAVPDELVTDFLAVQAAMNDAPRGDLDIRDFTPTADRLRTSEAAHRERGVERWTVCARERAGGRLVGLTELFVPDVPGAHVEQNDTAVVPAHRGHRLGLWLKSTNLLRLARQRPDLPGVMTWNAEENRPMLDVNHAIGFRCQRRLEERDMPVDALDAALVW